jgi:hypothetical protein
MATTMADPTPFLSTITGASAGLVAIIGGLLVNRFVGIDSEQQGAQAVLEQAEERLRIARARAEAAKQAWEALEVAEFLDDPDVLDAIRGGAREAAKLDPELLAITPLTPHNCSRICRTQPRSSAEQATTLRRASNLLPSSAPTTGAPAAGKVFGPKSRTSYPRHDRRQCGKWPSKR